MSAQDLALLRQLATPKLSQSVHREECTQCFDNQDGINGIDVCLTCFNGGCVDAERHHTLTHVLKTGHRFTLNVRRKPKPVASPLRAEGEEPPAKITKLAILEEREEDKYEHITAVKVWTPGLKDETVIPNAASDPKVKTLVDGVMQSMSSARQSEVKAWEEEITPCEHTLMLEQLASAQIPASGLAHCTSCSLTENLWLCLICGSLGCGRKQFGGTGGNGHGLEHYESSGHAVSVKLGTITPEGGADIYCYLCNDAKEDPDLSKHLASFGINVQTLSKTEKSMTELQIEQNLKYDFSLTGDDGKALEPLFGPGLTGLSNLGNSCYMASVLQTIFSLPQFQNRYFRSKNERPNEAKNHAESCTVFFPAECVECQIRKVGDGLLSGRYAVPAPSVAGNSFAQATKAEEALPAFQQGLKPITFKALIGRGHEEFATMRQQDAEEFFTHFLTTLRRDGVKFRDRGEIDATSIFSYATEQRLQCVSCTGVRYRTDNMDVVSVAIPATEKSKDAEGKVTYEDVELTQCIDDTLVYEGLDYNCTNCGKGVKAIKQTKFASLPSVLVVHAKKFQLINWVPTKLDIPVIVPANDELLFSEHHLGLGLQVGELELPNHDGPSASGSSGAAAPALPVFNEMAMAQLEAMGFPLVRCQKALLATGNSDPEAAMEWLFAHMEDPDIDDPIQITTGGGVEPDPEQISMLADMGFTNAQAKKALRETSGNVERAVEWLFNHPEDSGEAGLGGPNDDGAPAQPKAAAAPVEFPGHKSTPARYQLVAFISHKGPSVHSGHYVAHIKKGEEWVLFNDEKVVKADRESVGELKKLAYLYFFSRCD